MKRCRPPSSAIRSSPGRKCRWYVLPSRTVVPRTRSSSGSTVLTVAFVPTGMKAGVGTFPCVVCSTAARAAPSVAVTSNRSLIDAHTASVDDEIAAMLEAEAFVVRADAGILAETVEPQVGPAGRRCGRVRPVDDRTADSLSGASPRDRELVHVRRVGRSVAPVRRVVPEQRDGRNRVAVDFRQVDLAALDR